MAVYVSDLEKSRQFFARFFGAVSNSGYHDSRTGLRTYFLTFSEGTRLKIMHRPDVGPGERGAESTGYHHLASRIGSRQEVDDLTEKL